MSPAMSAAEKMRRYRERLKSQHPEKFEEQRRKNLERLKSKYKYKKISEMTQNEKVRIRKKWKEQKQKGKLQKTGKRNANTKSSSSTKPETLMRPSFSLSIETASLKTELLIDETDGPDIGKSNVKEERDIPQKRVSRSLKTSDTDNQYADGIPDFDDDVSESTFQSLQGFGSAPEPVSSWEKSVEVVVATDDWDAAACLGETKALKDAPTEITLYCDGDSSPGKPESGFESAQEPVFSWEKNVEVVPPDEEALEDAPSEISLYCDDDSSPGKQESVADKAQTEVQDYQCNECRQVIVGFRYTCVQCCDYDLCASCEARAAHSAHYVLRVPGDRPYSEIQAVLAAIRQQILGENLFLNVIDESLKMEIKNEPDEILPDSDKDPVPGLENPLPDVNDHLSDVNDHLSDVNDHLSDVNDHLSDVNDHLSDVNDHLSDVNDLWSEQNVLPSANPLNDLGSHSEDSRTESFEDNASDCTPPRSPEESIIRTDGLPTTSSHDGSTDHSPRRKRTRTEPFSKTHGDRTDLSHNNKMLQNLPSQRLENSTQRVFIPVPQKILTNNPTNASRLLTRPLQQKPNITKCKFVKVITKPVPILNQIKQSSIDVPVESEAHAIPLRRILFVPHDVLARRTPIKSQPKDLLPSLKSPRKVHQKQSMVKLVRYPPPEAPKGSKKFVPHLLKRISRKLKLVNLPLQPSQQRLVEDESMQTLQEKSVQIGPREWILRLPPDTNEVALLQSLQCPVTVGLKRIDYVEAQVKRLK